MYWLFYLNPDSGGFRVAHPARPPPPTVQNFLDFMQFFGKFDKIICWRPPPEGWRPLLQGILDPPLPEQSKYILLPFAIFEWRWEVVGVNPLAIFPKMEKSILLFFSFSVLGKMATTFYPLPQKCQKVDKQTFLFQVKQSEQSSPAPQPPPKIDI